MLVFRNDTRGLACLTWWRERCLEWCGSIPEPGRFGDQKYLDDWPQRFEGVHVVQHFGANLAPWNIRNHNIARRGDHLLIETFPVIFFHFHGFRRLTLSIYRIADGVYQLTAQQKTWLYDHYIDELNQMDNFSVPRGSPNCASARVGETSQSGWRLEN